MPVDISSFTTSLTRLRIAWDAPRRCARKIASFVLPLFLPRRDRGVAFAAIPCSREQGHALFEDREFVNGEWRTCCDVGADQRGDVRGDSHAALCGPMIDCAPVAGAKPYRDPVGRRLAR